MTNLLVADSDANVRDFLWEELTNVGFLVTAVSTGAEVIDKIVQQSYDVILLDLSIPDIDSIELIKQLREIALNCPILAMTGNVGRGDMARAKKLNITALTKPILISNLIEKIDTIKETSRSW